jgi:hypothetical protein
VLPAVSFTPDTSTVNCVEAANAALGLNDNTVDPEPNDVTPATAEPPCGVTDTVAPDWIGSDNVTDTTDDTPTPVAPDTGTVDTTLGAVESGTNDPLKTTSTQ